jgi:hypothetical protein
VLVCAALRYLFVASTGCGRTVNGMRLRLFTLLVACLTGLAYAAPASGHGGEPHEPIIVREDRLVDGSVLSATPRTLRVTVPSGVTTAEMVLRSASGRVLPLTGEVQVSAGYVEGSPPYLESGTYIVEVRYPNPAGSGLTTVAFSVGSESARVTGTGTSSSTPLLQMLAAAAALLAAACAAWKVRVRSHRWVTSILAAGAALLAAATALDGVGVPAAVASAALFTAAGPIWTQRASFVAVAGPLCAVAAGVLAAAGAPQGRGIVVGGIAVIGSLAIVMVVAALSLLATRDPAVNPREVPAPERFGAHADSTEPRDLAAVFAATGSLWLTLSVAGVTASLWWVAHLLRVGTASATGVLLTAAAGALVLFAVIPLVGVAVARLAGGTRFSPTLAPAAAVLVVAALLPLPAQLVERAPRVEALATSTVDPVSCLSGSNRLVIQRCLDEAYTATVRRDGVNTALEQLRTLFRTAPQARFFCHETSHAIGRESLRSNGDLAAAFADGFDVCDFGYYHGIVEAAAGHLDDAAFRAAVPELCGQLASVDQLFLLQCTHGLGHAAARRTNNDMVKALSFCEALEQSSSFGPDELAGALNGCGTGVTMEWFAVATSAGLRAVSPEVAEVREVCNEVPQRWAPECFEYVGNTLDPSRPVESLRELAGWCTRSASPDSCFIGLARAAGGVGVRPVDAIAICDLGGTARDGCVTFYIAGVATTIEYRVEVVDEICSLLPSKDRDGPRSLCEELRPVVASILAAGDGKPRLG